MKELCLVIDPGHYPGYNPGINPSVCEGDVMYYLAEAEKIFTAFDKVPPELWDEEYEKYKEVLKKYNDIKMLRWVGQ